MATYFALLAHRNEPVEKIFQATDEAEENRVRECEAATVIQSVCRMRRARVRYSRVRNCIIAMQRTYRGYCGRKRFLDLVADAQHARQRAVFDHFATTIQRAFRGFYSRKWRSDFYSQKHYLQMVQARAQQVRAAAEQQRARQEVDVADEEQRTRQEQFRETAGGLHHLLSTAVRSGVLRPAMASSGLETVFGTNIEDDLREAAAANPAPRKLRGRDLVPRKGEFPPPKGGSHVPQFGLGHSKFIPSLQSSAPYDAARDQRQLERAVDARMASQLHRTAFVPRKAGTAPAPGTLNAETPYAPTTLATLKRR